MLRKLIARQVLDRIIDANWFKNDDNWIARLANWLDPENAIRPLFDDSANDSVWSMLNE